MSKTLTPVSALLRMLLDVPTATAEVFNRSTRKTKMRAHVAVVGDEVYGVLQSNPKKSVLKAAMHQDAFAYR